MQSLRQVPIWLLGVACLMWMSTPTAAMQAAEVAAEPASEALADYVARPDDSFRFVVRHSGSLAGGTYAELTLVSQTWHDTVWKHQLFVFRPAEVRNAAHGLLLIGGGAWRDEYEQPAAEGAVKLPREASLLAAVANQVGSPVAVLLQVPHQPLLDGRYEDDAIAYTFEQYLRTGDDTWPLLLPMVKSAVRGMDAVQQFAQREWSLEVEKFTVTGASKRGWTTWLTAAVDERVVGLAPMVIDMLNLPPQMRHQLATWGNYSEQIQDYTRRGLQKHLESDSGSQLVSIVDPFAYRRAIQQPKLILLGTNDRYWPLDALNLYWDELAGDKYVLYVPNNGHGLNDYLRIGGTVAALHRHVAGEAALPQLDWEFDQQADVLHLTLRCDRPPQAVSAWTAAAETRDFRDARWQSRPAEPDGQNGWHCRLPLPAAGHAALFAEAVFSGQGVPFYLSTNVKIVGNGK